MDIQVIGAGPAGNFSAYLLAKQGHAVQVFDKKKTIGSPFQCTGILTEKVTSLLPHTALSKAVDNATAKARIIAGRESLEVKTKNYIVDRLKFDALLAGMAAAQGVPFFMGHKLVSMSEATLHFEGPEGKAKRVDAGIVVGADGPQSLVRAQIDDRKVFNWVGMQVKARMPDLDRDTILFYPSIGTYAWVVPENVEVARIGVVGNTASEASTAFNAFMSTHKAKVLCHIGGLIPRYDPKLQVAKGSQYLIGDAATQVKATTGGGIIPGMQAAKALADCLETGKSYAHEIKATVGKELKLHLLLRNRFDRFSETDFEKLIHICNTPSIKRSLEHTNRDELWKMVPALALNSWRFLPLVGKLL